MRTSQHLWIAQSVVFTGLGTYVLMVPVRNSRSYADAFILLGGALSALGLAAMLFAFKQRAQTRALAQHLGRGSRFSRGQNTGVYSHMSIRRKRAVVREKDDEGSPR